MRKIEINLQELHTLIESFDKLLVNNVKTMVLFKSNSIRVRDNHDEFIVNEYNKEYERRLNDISIIITANPCSIVHMI